MEKAGGEGRILPRVGPTTDIASECFLAFAAGGVSMSRNEGKKNTLAESKSEQKIKITNRD